MPSYQEINVPRLGSSIALSLAFALAPLPAFAIQIDPLSAGRTAPALEPAPAGLDYMMDAASAPPLSTMQAWQAPGTTLYDAIGVYVPVGTGLDSRYDKTQSNLTPGWVSSVIAGGWHVLPIYVGPQYACSTYTNTMSKDPAVAQQQGLAAAADAASSVDALGIPFSSPVVYDLEGVSERTANCSAAAEAFLEGWTLGLHQRGRNSGVYGSRASTMTDVLAATQADPGWAAPDVLWTATASGTPATSGYNPPPDGTWVGRRANQFNLSVSRTYGGVALTIDESAVDDTFWTLPSPDQTAPRIVAAAPPHVTKGGSQTLRWKAADPSGVAYYQYQLRHAVPGRPFGRWTAMSKRTQVTSKRVSLRPGEQWCVRVIVTDKAGNKTTPQVRCVARLSDDRSLRAGRGWSRVGGRYLGTSTVATRGSAVLRGGSVSGNYVVVMTHGPGAVVVAIGRHQLGTVHGNGVHVLRLPTALKGKLSMKTTSRKKIAIDGWAVTITS